MSYAPGFPFIIISAELKHADEEQNAFTTNLLAHALRVERLTFDSCLGRYKGALEGSFRICLSQYSIEDCNRVIELVEGLAHEYQQESILLVSPGGLASFYYPDTGEVVCAGVWRRATDHELSGESPDYTLIGGEFFVVSEESGDGS